MSRKKYKDVIEEIELRNNREKRNDATKVGQLVLMMINAYIYMYIHCPQKEKKTYSPGKKFWDTRKTVLSTLCLSRL